MVFRYVRTAHQVFAHTFPLRRGTQRSLILYASLEIVTAMNLLSSSLGLSASDSSSRYASGLPYVINRGSLDLSTQLYCIFGVGESHDSVKQQAIFI